MPALVVIPTYQEAENVVEVIERVRASVPEAHVLIVDDTGTAAIGGVMGAGSTEIHDGSTDVLLEAAVWDPAAVSRAAAWG